MIELNQLYRPIEGDSAGVVEDVQDKVVFWRLKDTVFLIPLERFTEFFTNDVTAKGDSA